MQDIIIKQVMDSKGAFSHIELCQGDNIINLSLSNTTVDVQGHSYKWNNLKDRIDTIAQRIHKELIDSLNLTDALSTHDNHKQAR